MSVYTYLEKPFTQCNRIKNREVPDLFDESFYCGCGKFPTARIEALLAHFR